MGRPKKKQENNIIQEYEGQPNIKCSHCSHIISTYITDGRVCPKCGKRIKSYTIKNDKGIIIHEE